MRSPIPFSRRRTGHGGHVEVALDHAAVRQLEARDGAVRPAGAKALEARIVVQLAAAAPEGLRQRRAQPLRRGACM